MPRFYFGRGYYYYRHFLYQPYFVNITVIGVFKKEGNDILGISDDKEILLPLNFAKNVIDVQNANYNPNIVVRRKSGISDLEVESEVRGLMRSIRRLGPGIEDNFALNKTTILSNQLDIVFGVLKKVGFVNRSFSKAPFK